MFELLQVNKEANSKYGFVILMIKDNKQIEVTVEELFEVKAVIDQQLKTLVEGEREKLLKQIENLKNSVNYFEKQLALVEAQAIKLID